MESNWWKDLWWKTSEGDLKERLEDSIQDLMRCGILANRDLPKNLQVFEPVAAILHVFHGHKNDRKVQAMVCYKYQPLLWRHLNSGLAAIFFLYKLF